MSLTDGRPAFSSPRPTSSVQPGGMPALPSQERTQAAAPFQNALGLYSAFSGPQLEILKQQAASLGNQLGMAGYGRDLAAQGLQSQYGFDQAQNRLAQQALGIDSAAAGRQKGYYNALYGVDAEKYRNNVGYQGQLKGFSNEDYAAVLQRLGQQAWEARYNAGRDVRRFLSGQTAAGAYTSAGSEEGRRDINAARDFTLDEIANQRTRADIGHRKDIAGIDNTIANLTSDFKAAGLTKNEQIARLSDRQAQLGIQSKQLGIQSDELASRLQQGLATLNLNHVTSVGQIMDALASNNQQQAQWAMNVMQQALQAGLVGA